MSFVWVRSGKHNPQVSSDGTNNIINEISKLDIDADVNSKTVSTVQTKVTIGVKECKCGMPLCICEAPAPSSDAPPQQVLNFYYHKVHTSFGAVM